MYLRLLSKLITIIVLFNLLGCSPSPKGDADSLEELKGRYQELVEHYQGLINAEPANLELKLNLAKAYYGFKDYLQVKELLDGIDTESAKIILAKALARAKDYDYAIEIFEQLKSTPQDDECLYLHGQVLEEKNLFPKALEIYAKAGGSFKTGAQARIEFIKAKVEDSIPDEITVISEEAKGYINQLKDDAAIYLLVEESVEITSDNRSLSTIHVLEKVLKERGKELAEVQVGYDSTYERVELEFARTVTKEGKVIYAGGESIRNIGLYQNFPLYSNSRVFIVSMPSVEVGSFIEYKIKVYSSKLINQDDFSQIYRLREKYPVFKADFTLIIPEGREAKFKIFNQDYAESIIFEPNLRQEQAKKIYTWNFSQIAPIIPEYSMPTTSYINPAFAISSFGSWDEIYQWWKSLYQDKVQLSQEIENFTRELTKDISDSQDKAKKIHEFVAKNIRYVAIEYGDSGYEPHYANDVFINRYGDCKDQAILLVAMLRSAGLKAYPVLIPTRAAYPLDKDFPTVLFNHAIAAVEIDGELIFMDPTAETVVFKNIPLGDQDREVLVFLDDTWRITKIGDQEDNGIIYTMDIAIDNKENAIITRKVETRGFHAASYRWYLKHTHPATIKEEIQQKMTEISSLSQLIDYEIKDADNFDTTPTLKYKFAAEKFLNPAGNLRIVPILDQIDLDHALISKEKRDYPLDFDGMYNLGVKIKISLPENLRVQYLPPSTSLENSWFKLNLSYEQESNQIKFQQLFRVKKRFVDKSEYEEFKAHFKEALYLLREEIILEVSSKPSPAK
ncbi:MAG: DUF3857 domain-containing protein [Candidatus Omnitrophota bacterium]